MTPDEREPLLQAAERIVDRLDRVDEGLGGLIASQRRSKKWIVGLGGATAAAVIAIVLGVYVLVGLVQTNRCLTVVVAATADRTGALAPKNKTLQDANKAVELARAKVFDDIFPLDGAPRATREQFLKDGQAVTTAQAKAAGAQKAYDDAYVAHPPPANPRNAC